MGRIVRFIRPHPERVSQETLRDELVWLLVILLGVVDVPDVYENSSALRYAMTIVDVILGRGMGDRLRSNWTPAVDLSVNALSVPQIPRMERRNEVYLVPKRLGIL